MHQVVRALLDLLLDGTPAPNARAACEHACTVLLAQEAERCSDPVMTLRRQALVDWTELVLAHPNQPPLWRCVAVFFSFFFSGMQETCTDRSRLLACACAPLVQRLGQACVADGR